MKKRRNQTKPGSQATHQENKDDEDSFDGTDDRGSGSGSGSGVRVQSGSVSSLLSVSSMVYLPLDLTNLWSNLFYGTKG